MDRMKKIIKKALVLSMALLFFMVFTAVPLNSLAAPAAGVTTIGVSKKDLKVGDSLSVTVTCTTEASITLRYSASRLKLDDPGTGTADGNTVTFKATRNTIRFTATAAGKADLIVASADAGVSGSSASVTITDSAAQSSAAPQAPASSAAPENPAPASSAAPEAPASSEAPAAPAQDLPKGQVSSNGKIYAVSERYTDASIPAGFSRTSLSIAKGTYEEVSNGTITLVYLKLINNGTMENEGSFFYYDEALGTFSPLIPYLGTFVIPLSEGAIPESETLSQDLFSKSDMTFNNVATLTIPDSYVLKADPGDFHYFYGKTFEGLTMWFNYDSATGSLQRADSALLKDYQSKASSGGSVSPQSGEASSSAASSSQAASESRSGGFSFQKVLLIIIIFIVIFIILVIISMIPKRRDDDDDEEEDEEEEDFGRSIVKKEFADEDEEDDDDLPYGDDEDDDEDEDYYDEDEVEEEKAKEKAPEKTKVMPDVSDNGLRKILSSDAIIASGADSAVSQPEKKPEATPAKKAEEKRVVSKPDNSALKPAGNNGNNANGSGDEGEPDVGKKIDVMDLNDL
ncbi:MAG: hypothetical protein IJJ79_00410 [Lachnospiraceae bacterium]|nr:hypothetical protein [Lachnospiraceae bacterium]